MTGGISFPVNAPKTLSPNPFFAATLPRLTGFFFSVSVLFKCTLAELGQPWVVHISSARSYDEREGDYRHSLDWMKNRGSMRGDGCDALVLPLGYSLCAPLDHLNFFKYIVAKPLCVLLVEQHPCNRRYLR